MCDLLQVVLFRLLHSTNFFLLSLRKEHTVCYSPRDISSYRISAHAIKVANCPKDGGNERYQNKNPKTSISSRKEQEAITSDKRKKTPQ